MSSLVAKLLIFVLFFLTIIGLVTPTENSFDGYTKVGPAELWSFSQWSMGWQGCNQ